MEKSGILCVNCQRLSTPLICSIAVGKKCHLVNRGFFSFVFEFSCPFCFFCFWFFMSLSSIDALRRDCINFHLQDIASPSPPPAPSASPLVVVFPSNRCRWSCIFQQQSTLILRAWKALFIRLVCTTHRGDKDSLLAYVALERRCVQEQQGERGRGWEEY